MARAAFEAGVTFGEVVAEDPVVEEAAVLEHLRLGPDDQLDQDGQADQRSSRRLRTGQEQLQEAGHNEDQGERSASQGASMLSLADDDRGWRRTARSIRPPSKGRAGSRLASKMTQFR